MLQLGDRSSLERDMSIMTYIGSAKTNTDLEIHAWISRILLFEMLEFSNLHLLYRVKTASEFELTGTVALHLNVSERKPVINFDGKLSVNSEFAKFNTQSCLDIVSQPCGIHVRVNDLKLALKMYLEWRKSRCFCVRETGDWLHPSYLQIPSEGNYFQGVSDPSDAWSKALSPV